jgi:signal transduction histidine kinase
LQAQRRFVADASHELRTPLTTIRGNIGLLRREPPINAEDRADILADTVDETDRLIRLVNDLLVLARADAQQLLQNKPIQVAPLLEDACRQIKLLAPQRTLECQIEPNLTVTADGDALKQVLLALLDNALKHTPPEAVIIVKTITGRNSISISVGDNGPGIEQTELPQIFDRFYRGDPARSGPGTGLGLAIASELIKAQNGTLKVESQPGQGTVFTLKFPKPSSTGQDDQTAASNGQG